MTHKADRDGREQRDCHAESRGNRTAAWLARSAAVAVIGVLFGTIALDFVKHDVGVERSDSERVSARAPRESASSLAAAQPAPSGQVSSAAAADSNDEPTSVAIEPTAASEARTAAFDPQPPTPLVGEIVAKVNAELSSSVQNFCDSSLDPAGEPAARRAPVWLRRGDDWVIETAESDGPVLGVGGGRPFASTRARMDAVHNTASGAASLFAGDIGDESSAAGAPQFEQQEYTSELGDITCTFGIGCHGPVKKKKKKTVLPDPDTCKLNATTHPTHPDCNPDTFTHPLCQNPTIAQPNCMPTFNDPGCNPTWDAVCWGGGFGGGGGYGGHWNLDPGGPGCLWIFGWPTMPKDAVQDFYATATPPGGAFNWSVVQPGNQISLSGTQGATVTVTANALSAHYRDVKLKCSYTYVDSQGVLTQIDDEYPLTVFRYDIQFHRPLVIDTAETPVTEATELTIGAQTWVNIDNDDDDDTFDDTDADVTTGDDELVRVTLRVQPSDMRLGGLGLTPLTGGASVRGWKDPQKTLPHTFGSWWYGGEDFFMSPTSDNGYYLASDSGGTWWAHDVWVEGIEPSSGQRDVTFRIEYDGLIFVPVCHFNIPPLGGTWPQPDSAALTVLGSKEIFWVGKDNAFDPPGHAQDILDDDPLNATLTFPNGDPISNKRVVPDSRAGAAATPHDKVELEVTLSTAPVEDVDLYVHSLDLDDPSADTAEIDPNDANASGTYHGTTGSTVVTPISYSVDEDNRGEVNTHKNGEFAGQDANQIAPIHFTANNATAKVDFTTTQGPGDNFIAVVNGDRDFLGDLENKDHEDHFGVYESHVKAGANDGQVLEDRPTTRYVSDALTVWRILHIENDSMQTVITAQGTGSNHVFSTLSSIAINSGHMDLGVGATLGDGSADLSSGASKGRFENGTLHIGTHVINQLDGNGTAFVRKTPVPDIPFSLTAATQPTITGTLGRFGGMTFTLRNPSSPLTAAYVGGTLSTCGATLSVTGVNVPVVQVTVGSVSLAIELIDDDVETLLPHDADVSLLGDIYDDCYYYAQVDGGSASSNNTQNLTFKANLTSADLISSMQQGTPPADETPTFWVAYIGTSYQSELVEDRDSDTESGTGGVTPLVGSNTVVIGGRDCCWIFRETCHDRETHGTPPADPLLESRVVAHELGHQLGLTHSPSGTSSIMDPSMQQVPSLLGLIPLQINLLRCHQSSP